MKNGHFFFFAIQNKLVVYMKRWYFRGFAFVHYSIDNDLEKNQDCLLHRQDLLYKIIWQFRRQAAKTECALKSPVTN